MSAMKVMSAMRGIGWFDYAKVITIMLRLRKEGYRSVSVQETYCKQPDGYHQVCIRIVLSPFVLQP
jgi:hypothetical protein